MWLPVAKPWHLTAASSACLHDEGTEPIGEVEVQLNRDSCVVPQVRPLIQIGPVPSPKAALAKTADAIKKHQQLKMTSMILELAMCIHTWTKSSLTTSHITIIHIPAHVTHWAPLVLVTDLYTAFAVTSSSHQPNITLGARCMYKLCIIDAMHR